MRDLIRLIIYFIYLSEMEKKEKKAELLSDELYSTQFIYWHDVNIYQKRDWRYKIMVDDSLIDIVENPEIAEIAVKYYVQWLEDWKILD
jgi:hypothetical protein